MDRDTESFRNSHLKALINTRIGLTCYTLQYRLNADLLKSNRLGHSIVSHLHLQNITQQQHSVAEAI
jgi:hypothetical protein